MNYKTQKDILSHAAQLGYKTAAQFAKFLKLHHHILAGGRA